MTTAHPKKVDAATLRTWLADEEALLIDIREPDEYVREHIPESRLVSLSAFNTSDFAHEHEKIGVFHCQSGTRTAQAAAQLLSSGFRDVYQLEGGLQAWKQAGLPMNVNRRAPIGIMRQVQISAGSLVVIGAVLATLVDPWFISLSAFVGAGLVFAGVTGTCGMASMLALMPWNRQTEPN